MKREIKFRAWDNWNKAMSIDVHHLDCLNELLHGEKWIVMQFTGLKDKNGKDIYEGDIISSDAYPFTDEGNPNYVGTVEWVFSSWQYVLTCVNPNKRGISGGINNHLQEGDEETVNFEVIGNIFENPELFNS